MRMRRTAFIMALMTVFTVSLFAQSRGRNYIKQNISEWGGCRNVAITDTGGDLALNGKNDYAYTAGIPQALADALEKYHDDDDYIDDVQHRDSRTVVGRSLDQRRLRALLRERIQVSRQRAPETEGCPQGHEV